MSMMMKRSLMHTMLSALLVVALSVVSLSLFQFSSVHGFITTSTTTTTTTTNIVHNHNRISTTSSSSSSTQLFFFGAAKDDGSPGDYVCKDCGYVFTGGPKKWAALDDKKYKCPPCGAPKFRFKKVPKGSESGKVEVKKSWF